MINVIWKYCLNILWFIFPFFLTSELQRIKDILSCYILLLCTYQIFWGGKSYLKFDELTTFPPSYIWFYTTMEKKRDNLCEILFLPALQSPCVS